MKQLSFKTRQTLIAVISGFLFLAVTVIASQGIVNGAGSGQLGTSVVGWGYFKAFTIDSNVLAGLTAAAVLFFSVRNLARGEDSTPDVLLSLCHMSATALMLTMLITACFLAPGRVAAGKSYFSLFTDDMFFFHFLDPVLWAAALCLMNSRRLGKRDVLISMIPTVIYSVVYFAAVVVLKVWPDFYNFTLGWNYAAIPFTVLAIYLVTLIAALILKAIHNRCCRA